jgi:hypothetical protein
MSDFSPQERQRLVSMYTTQYNQTNLHINRLFNTLDDIRHNLNTLIGNNNNNNNNNNNMSRQYRLNRPNRTTPPQHNVRENSSPFNQSVYYDYTNPIDRSTYISENINPDISNFLSDIIANNTSNINDDSNSPEVDRFISDFLNSIPIRPTQEQINNASSLVIYSDIQTPNSSSCVISLEQFAPSDTVRHIHHCGHIFFPEQFNQWFSNNVRCPVCRHDIRNTTIPIFNQNTDLNLATNMIDQLTIDLLTSEISNNI